MTPDEIEKAAIEAAAKAMHAVSEKHSGRNISWDVEESWCKLEWLEEATAAIRAYEREMWIKGEPPKDGNAYLCKANGTVVDLQWFASQNAWAHGADYDSGWKPTHFRPLPKPEGV